MNGAHYHLIINHLPIFSTLFGLLILLLGLIMKRSTLKNVAFTLLVIGGIFSYVALETGEGAEDILKEEPFFNHEMHERIEHHEHKAKDAFWVAVITGIVSIIGLLGSRFSRKTQYVIDGLVVVLSAISLALLIYTSYLGGAIRHTEAYGKEKASVIQQSNSKALFVKVEA